MELYPAIDLRGGRVVRLEQGDFARERDYGTDPLTVAQQFADDGAVWLHIVDLDAAKGDGNNRAVVQHIARSLGQRLRVQTGGGVRSVDAAKALFDAGVTRCVIGTAAVEQPDLVAELARAGRRVAVGLDVLGDEIMVRGWEQRSALSIFDLLPRFSDVGADAVVVTQIHNDGMGGGADVDGLKRVLGATSLAVIASGGVGTVDHIRELVAVDVDGRCLAGVIAGKALHDGAISLDDALAATRSPGAAS